MARLAVSTLAALAGLVCLGAVPTALRAQPFPSVKGTVIFEGEAPERGKLRRDTDPVCAKVEALAEEVIVTHGKLKDVLVRVKNGTRFAGPARRPAVPPVLPPVLIDQKDCAYSPHVVGLVAGQKLAVRNSDGTFHNVHGTIDGKLVWNKPAAPGDPALTLDGSARAGDVIDIVCDVHPWMHAYAVVQDHAVFAVTGEDGSFELRGIPPGSYVLEAWHPVLGVRSLAVKIGVGAKGSVLARFSYNRMDMK